MNASASEQPELEQLLAQQREGWRNGTAVSVRQLCSHHAWLHDDREALLDLIYNEILLRREMGEAPVLESYLEAFPHVSFELRLTFQVDQGLDDTSEVPRNLASSSASIHSQSTQRLPVEISHSNAISNQRIQTSRGDSVEVSQLLRRRLLVCATILAGIYAQAFIQMRALFFASAGQVVVQLVIGAASCCIAALLWYRKNASMRWLRTIELLVFGLPTFQLSMFLIERLWMEGDLLRSLQPGETFRGHLFNTVVLCYFPLVASYGVLIPNTGWRCLCVTLVIGLIPIVVLIGGIPFQLKTLTDHAALFCHGLLWVGAWMSVAVVIASFGSFRIYSLEKQVKEARSLGSYRLKEKIGSGGMGEVYLGEHVLLKQPCAIKLIRPDRVNDPQTLARFEREVQATARLKHPNTIKIYDYGRHDDGMFYYVMEYLPGLTLEQIVQQYGPMSVDRVLFIMRQICGPLREAHAMGLVHRDIKPANLIISRRGGVADLCKLLDFGLVKDLDKSIGDATLTHIGSVAGTPAYMSPEQIAGHRGLDARSDIYSVGALAFFLLAGRPPFEGTAIQVMAEILHSTPVDIRSINPTVPNELAAIVQRCLAKDRDQRFESVAQLSLAVDDMATRFPWTEADANDWWDRTT